MRPSALLASKRDLILSMAAARGARDMRVFGSVARGDDGDNSDIDLLIEMPSGTSLLQIVALQHEIADELGVAVDLCTERELHPALRDGILAEARAL